MNKDFIIYPEFENRLDGGSLYILNAMTEMPRDSICFYLSQLVHKSMRNNTLQAILISNHFDLLGRFGIQNNGEVKADGTMPGDPGAATGWTEVTKNYYILINSKYFLGQEKPEFRYQADNKEWRPSLSHELSHFINHDSEKFPETLIPTQDFYFDVKQAKKFAKMYNKSIWDVMRTCCGEFTCRFINWYIWEELFAADKKTVALPNAVTFFNRAVREVINYIYWGYDHTSYLAYLQEEDLKDKGVRLPMQTALFLENVGNKYDLFDRYMNPPLRAKKMFLEAAEAFRLDPSIYNIAISERLDGYSGLH